MQRTCIHCGATFEPRSHRDKLCSDTCRAKRQSQHSMAWAKRHPERMQAAQQRFASDPDNREKKRQYLRHRHHQLQNYITLMAAYALHQATQPLTTDDTPGANHD